MQKRFFIFPILLACIILMIWVFWKFWVLPVLESPMQKDKDILFYDFKQGSSLNQLTSDLKSYGILPHPNYLLLYAKINKKTKNLKSGVYRIIPNTQSPIDLLEMLHKGGVAQFSFRTQEGHTLKQMLKKVSNSKDIVHTLDEWSPEEVMIAIGEPGKPYEGYFYPDTYLLPHGFTDIDFFKKSHKMMQTILDIEWKKRDKDLLLKSPYEALILASIIEKETTNYAERFKVSGVFHNRLKKKMRLQTDPTVIYGMGDKYKGNITKKDLRTKTPYNTYRINGLPPTPISTPSWASINAALHPENTKALYFVSKGNGTHYFSDTYAEHRRAVRKYQIDPYKKRLAERHKKKALEKKLSQKNKVIKKSKINLDFKIPSRN